MDRPNRSHPTLSPLTSLPTSPSYLYPTTSIPTTPSLLSRPSSQTRLRPTSASTPALQKHTHPHPKKNKKRTTTTRNTHDADEDDWITRTASTLTLTRLEEKGQAWLAARHSSTSLTAGDAGGDDEEEVVERGWRNRAARGSSAKLKTRSRSRRGSATAAAVAAGGGWDGVREYGEGEDVGPDFVDVEDEEEEEGEEEVDEGEMRRVVMGRVGGWVDWAVGWMDFRGEGEDEEEEEEGDPDVVERAAVEEVVVKGELDPVELQKRLRRKKRKDEEVEIGSGEGMDNTVGSAPERAGVWSDAKWLLSVAAKVAL